ncbi:MAG TPA: class I SAM-dependent methyltransferase [Burkholderiales bacterium]|nr:class I SAM-dependent methyltransferase [Burkholderiales bacterium]
MRRAFLVLFAGLVPVGAACAQQGAGDVVYVPTPQVVVDRMLAMANVGQDDYLIDLGSGDGRVVITAAKRGARALGVDLDRHLLGVASEAAKREGVAERASFREQNLFETDLADATVVTSYLLPDMNLKLRPKILALKPGTRVVAHDYHMGDWLPDARDVLSVPEKKVGTVGISYVYLWHVPARVAGRWQGAIPFGTGTTALELDLEQKFQVLTGQATAVAGRPTRLRAPTIRGDALAFLLEVGSTQNPVRYSFRGRVAGDEVRGTVVMSDPARGQREHPWSAQRVAPAAVRQD